MYTGYSSCYCSNRKVFITSILFPFWVVLHACIHGWIYDSLVFLLSYLCIFTQGNFFSRVCRQEEDEQGQTRDQHTGNEQIEAIIERPATHGDCEGHIRVRLFTTLVIQLITLGWYTCKRKTHLQVCFSEKKNVSDFRFSSNYLRLFKP